MKSSPGSLLISLGALVLSYAGIRVGCLPDPFAGAGIPLEIVFNELLAKNQGPAYAACRMFPNKNSQPGQPRITGHVLFKQLDPKSGVEGYFNLQGFPSSSIKHPMHVHELGSVWDSCESTGKHYNPFNTNHPNHPGDFNNFEVTGGKIVKRLTGLKVTLFGINSILSRGVVLHNGVDDLGQGGDSGSLQDGNSGRPIACCVIRVSTVEFWNSIAST
ncbi:extracellular superoxide dismutase [Cu-Zn]-like [Callorhinchus milii]|uniref:extracellular superoxide dismutase [Cu-Zn]-like n=1 Tax=Callorhinchus milii TaxID=7868 RepID=UPI001C3F9686|nr:extracellular superoxide dismutase [Cu-Zn]-like [Callorhinchus milii]